MSWMQRLSPCVAAVCGIVVTLVLFYPGYMSFDSAYQWWQVRHDIIDPAHPPIMVLIWEVTEKMIAGPGAYFIFQTLLYWCALALFIAALPVHAVSRMLVLLTLGFWPPLWGLSLHLWKDIGTLSFFCLAAACLAHDYNKPHRAWRISALLCVLLACAYRHNALSAGVIFILYGVHREVSIYKVRQAAGKIRVLAGSAVIVCVVQMLLMLPGPIFKLKSEPLWPLQAQWDIAAVSVHENRLLFPPGWTSPKLSMALLKRDFNPSVNVPIFHSSLIYVNPYYPMSEQDFKRLRTTWLRLPIDYPQAYWQHRWYVTKNLFGWRQDPAYPNYVFSPGIVAYKDNPAISAASSPQAQNVQTHLSALTETPLFYGWAYALLSVLLCVFAWHRRHKLALMLALSALCYVLPLIVLAPSCDFRYLVWLLLGSMLAALALFALPADMPDQR